MIEHCFCVQNVIPALTSTQYTLYAPELTLKYPYTLYAPQLTLKYPIQALCP